MSDWPTLHCRNSGRDCFTRLDHLSRLDWLCRRYEMSGRAISNQPCAKSTVFEGPSSSLNSPFQNYLAITLLLRKPLRTAPVCPRKIYIDFCWFWMSSEKSFRHQINSVQKAQPKQENSPIHFDEKIYPAGRLVSSISMEIKNEYTEE